MIAVVELAWKIYRHAKTISKIYFLVQVLLTFSLFCNYLESVMHPLASLIVISQIHHTVKKLNFIKVFSRFRMLMQILIMIN